MKFRIPFRSNKKAESKSQSLEDAQTKVAKTQKPVITNTVSTVATQQTLEYLRKVELDDVLELMYPRLIVEQQTRLKECNRELEEIDQELARLYTSRDDVQGVMKLNQTNS